MQSLLPHHDDETRSLRDRWPRGFFGALAYFTDHIVFRFDAPVDWLAARIEDDYGYSISLDVGIKPKPASPKKCEVDMCKGGGRSSP